MATREYDNVQRSGTEYGGLQHTPSGIQPKPSEAFTSGEILRLGYTTGNENDYQSIDDTRQMLGLRPADGRRPLWLRGASPTGDPRLESVADIQTAWQEAIDEDALR